MNGCFTKPKKGSDERKETIHFIEHLAFLKGNPYFEWQLSGQFHVLLKKDVL